MWKRAMAGRDRTEEHRTSTPLELLFDLCFVVAVSQAASQLTHGIADGHTGQALIGYLMVFFAIWNAWMNFTWFASAYDTDDVPYRLLTLVQIAGVLVLAAGVPSAFANYDFRAVVVGYVIMRLAMVGQWLRVATEHPEGRATALKYAAGTTVVQLCWIARLWLPGAWGYAGFALLAALELAVPVWAERSGRGTPWHPEHIAERYGLFTLIVLGECVLASTVAIQAASATHGISPALLVIAFAGLVLIFGIWWSYFDRPAVEPLRESSRSAFVWGYGHYFIFAAIAALGAGLEIAAETVERATKISTLAAAYCVAIPVAAYLLIAGFLQSRLAHERGRLIRNAAIAVLVLPAGLIGGASLPGALLVMAIVFASALAIFFVRQKPPARDLAAADA